MGQLKNIKSRPVKNTLELIEIMENNHKAFQQMQAAYFGKKAVYDFIIKKREDERA